MTLNRTPRRGFMLIALVAYGLMSLYYLVLLSKSKHAQRRQPQQQAEYYNQAIAATPTQWGKRSATVCGPDGCYTVDDSNFTGWCIPSSRSQPWEYKVNNQVVGTVSPDGGITGFADGLPSHWPSNMPSSIQARVTESFVKGQRTTIPGGPAVIGEYDPQEKPTGVDKAKLEESRRNTPSGWSTNGVGVAKESVRGKFTGGAKASGLKDFDQFIRVSVIGPEAACTAYRKVVDNLPKDTREKILFDCYDPDKPEDEHHITGHLAGAKPLIKPGKAIAYVQFADGGTPSVAEDADGLRDAIGQLRDPNASGFDVEKAKVGFKTSNEVIGISFLLLLVGIPLLWWTSR